jgi:hypothetical protein
MRESAELDIVNVGAIASDEEILEVVDLVVEYREGRHPRPGKVYRAFIDGQVVDFREDEVPVRGMLLRVGKEPDQGWVLYEIMHGREIGLDPRHTVHLRRHGLERFVTRQELVPIEVNQAPKQVHPGCWVVTDLKTAVGVPAEKVLAEIKPNGGFENLDDGARIEIRGGEKFISHARRGGSS